MNRFTKICLLCGIVVCCFIHVAVFAAEEEKKGVEYIIERGDTLWSISRRFLKKPYKMSDLLEKNGNIKNPDIIYPGDKILFPAYMLRDNMLEKRGKRKVFLIRSEGGEAVEGRRQFGEFGKKEAASHVVGVTSSGGIPAKIIKKDMVASCGFIVDKKDIPSAVITGHKMEGIYLYEGAEGYAKKDTMPLEVGKKYTVFRYERKVKHPESKKDIGFLVRILGEAEVKSIENGLAKILILNSYEEISVGDLLMEHYSIDVPNSIRVNKDASISGIIVDGYGNYDSFMEGNFVYVDLGKSNGVFQGQMFSIYKKQEGMDVFEKASGGVIEIGKFVSLLVSEHFTSGFIYKSKVPVEIGFTVKSD